MDVHCFPMKNNKRETFTEYAFFWIILLGGIIAWLILLLTYDNNKFSFSIPSGFYDESFILYIDGPSSDIFYTLDGSEPNKNSIKYTNDGIKIENILEYNIAVNKEISGGYYDFSDIDVQDNSFYRINHDKYDTGCVVRAVCYNNKGKEEITGFYKIGSNYECPIYTVSLIVDPENLIDYENGIYVLGKEFDAFKENNKEWTKIPWRWWGGNFRIRGRESEREAYVIVFDELGNCISNSKCGIRIHGNVSRGFAQKGFNLYFRNIYGEGMLNRDIFGIEGLRCMTLDSSSSDCTKFQDKLVTELCNSLNIGVMDYIPSRVYINGEYWGLYNITEKYDKYYLSQKYNVNKDDVVIIKNGQTEEGVDADLIEYNKFRDFVINSDMLRDENYLYLCENCSIDSLIDYYAVNIYIDNSSGDWPASNYAMWKTRSNEMNDFGDGKYRFLMFDLNAPDIMLYSNNDTIEYLLNNDAFFSSVWKNNYFREKLLNKLLNLSNDVFTTENVENELNIINDYLIELKNSYNRFYYDDSICIMNRLYSIRKFYEERKNVMIKIVEKYKTI